MGEEKGGRSTACASRIKVTSQLKQKHGKGKKKNLRNQTQTRRNVDEHEASQLLRTQTCAGAHVLTYTSSLPCPLPPLSAPPAHTMMAQSQVQTRACIWNREWIHITCVVCCLSGSGASIMNRNIQPPQAEPWCLCTCKGFLKRGTDTQVCHSDACPGLKRQTQRRFPVLSHFPPGELSSAFI